MRTMRKVMVCLAMAMLAPLPATAAPLPEVLRIARETPKEPLQPACACHEAGYPRCDCGQGPACRCIRLGQYAHLPTRETCRKNLDLANAWTQAVLIIAREPCRKIPCQGQ